MARKFRLCLLLTLFTLTTLFMLLPSKAFADGPSCTGRSAGSYHVVNALWGYNCSSDFYCVVAHQNISWDCVDMGGGQLAIENVVENSPDFCGNPACNACCS
jgi:hypothetical protein